MAMVGEVTMICVDTSRWMLYPENSHWFAEQAAAIQLYSERKLKAHPDNLIGLITMGELHCGCSLEPTDVLDEVKRVLRAIHPQPQFTDLLQALLQSLLSCEFGWTVHYEDMPKRIVVFVGGPFDFTERDLTNVTNFLKESAVVVDVVDFGAPVKGEEYKAENLHALVNAMNNNNEQRSHYFRIPDNATTIREHLLASPILPPVAQVGSSGMIVSSRRPVEWVQVV